MTKSLLRKQLNKVRRGKITQNLTIEIVHASDYNWRKCNIWLRTRVWDHKLNFNFIVKLVFEKKLFDELKP